MDGDEFASLSKAANYEGTVRWGREASNCHIREHLVLPFETESGGNVLRGVINTLHNVANDRWVCNILIDRPVTLNNGAALTRKITFIEPLSNALVPISSLVAIVEELLQ
jgi:hypothetical protein